MMNQSTLQIHTSKQQQARQFRSASMKSRSHAMRVEVSKKKRNKQGQVQKRNAIKSQNHKSSNIPTEDFKSIQFDPMPNLKSKFSNRKNSVDVAKLLSKNRLKNKAHLRYQATNKMNSLRKLKLKNKNKIIYQKFLPVNQPNSSILYDNSKLPSIENERNLSNFERSIEQYHQKNSAKRQIYAQIYCGTDDSSC